MCVIEYLLSEATRAFVDHFELRAHSVSSEYGHMRLSALLMGEDACNVAQRIPASFKDMPHWADGLARRVWVDLDGRAICTYCEHDLFLDLFDREEAFGEALDRARAFYADH